MLPSDLPLCHGSGEILHMDNLETLPFEFGTPELPKEPWSFVWPLLSFLCLNVFSNLPVPRKSL